jgi:guanylate kinase
LYTERGLLWRETPENQIMTALPKGRLVILSGPSGVGKSPLEKALQRFFPELSGRLQRLVLYNSRAPRPGESDGADYHFRSREHIEGLRSDSQFVVMEVRGDLQAIHIEALSDKLAAHHVLFEGNPFIGRILQTASRLSSVPKLSVYMAPLSRDEILELKRPDHHISLSELVTDVMRRKLLRRTRKQKLELSGADLANIEKRASSAYRELREAWHFDYVIPNHDGEDSEHWDAFYYPIGDARKSLRAFAALLQEQTSPDAEKWEKNLLP